MTSRSALVLTLVLAAVIPRPSIASSATVEHFSPRGEIKAARQVVARFSQPMVPLGDPRGGQLEPFEISCSPAGHGRWVDSRTWVYDFEEDLPAGIRCRFALRSGMATLAGDRVEPAAFVFTTGGPAVTRVLPWPEGEIDEDQAFVLFLDGDPTPQSVLAHASFAAEGIAEKIGVHLVDGDEREAIVTTLDEGEDTARLVVLRARQRFPSQAAVTLTWGRGIETLSGVATSTDQVFAFKTRKPFTAEFSCSRENAKADCLPLARLRVSFSEPVAAALVSRIVLRAEDGRVWVPTAPEHGQPTYEAEFTPPFPDRAKLILELPAGLTDEAGRVLINADQFPLQVKTGPFPPLAKFSSRFGIVESEAAPMLPVTVRSIEPEIRTDIARVTAERATGLRAQLSDLWNDVTGNVVRLDAAEPAALLPWLRRVAWSRRSTSVFETGLEPPRLSPNPFAVPKPNGADALEVVGIPLGSPGLYIVEIESKQLGASLLGKQAPMYVATAALVTNLSVHLKWGDANSLVWVTTLDEAQPVGLAEVLIQNCEGETIWSGVTGPDGTVRVDGLPARESLPSCYSRWSPSAGEGEDSWLEYDYEQTADLRSMASGLLVIARTRGDISFVHSSWKRGIESWRFRVPSASTPSPLVTHTVFDQTLFRAGDTVHMKHLARLESLTGFDAVPAEELPASLTIEREGSNDKYELPLEWDGAGAADTTWEIPATAKLGNYRVVLRRGEDWRSTRVGGSFRVEEFRVPLMRAKVGLPAQPQVRPAAMPVDFEAHYLAGGAASGLPVIVRSQIRPKRFLPPIEYENFTFANGSVQPGITRRVRYDDESALQPAVHQRLDLNLEDSGTARATITDLPSSSEPKELSVEMEFRDPNGERQTVAASVPLWPGAALAGIDVEDWTSAKGKLSAKVAVVDVETKPIAGAKVRVEAFKRTTYSHRERLAGGFYAYEHVTEVSPSLGVVCEGTTAANGLFFCEASPPAEGGLILVASTQDAGGNTSAAHAEVWVTGQSQWWFKVSHSDRIDVLPEKPRYEPGETARFQVRMPFSEATALVSVEREGIAETQVVHLSGDNPVVEVPILGSYAPNVFVSVLALRGRIGGVQPTAMLDLGRPAYKLGIAEVRVGWAAHQLEVNVQPERVVYRVREKVTTRIQVRTAAGDAPPPGSEVAFAAVDEGLLELRENESWDLLGAMMGRRGYGVETATAQTQVVGRRHYGLKALPQGGGGGRQATRELFETMLLWKGRVALDAAGDAVVEVPLNDSLTSFRLVAVATGSTDLFGTGSAVVRSTQDLMVLPALPPVVREGDRFRAEVTVRNTTDAPLELNLSATASEIGALAPQPLVVAGGTAALAGWEITVPTGVSEIQYDFDATAAGGASDRVRRVQRVLPAVPVRIFQATLNQCVLPIRQPVRRPADALPGRGGVHVDVAPSLLVSLDGVRQWIRDYPYTCFEQQLARAVILRDEPRHWTDLAALLPTYLDDHGLVKFFPEASQGSEVLTAHVLSLADESGLSIPDEPLGRMLEGLRAFVDGEIERAPWARLAVADLSLRKLAAIEALSRYDAARAPMLDSITIEPNLWPTSSVISWWNILLRMPTLTARDARLEATEQILRSRLDLAGTSIGFPEQFVDALWWLIVPPDSNPLRLTLTALDSGRWNDDLPRLMKAALDRQRGGAWDSTISNAWGSLAVERFARRFESEKVSGTTSLTLGASKDQLDWRTTPAGSAFDLPWPDDEDVLSIEHSGRGAPWTVVQSHAAVPLLRPLTAGYRVEKVIVPIEVKTPGVLSAGDIVRVRLIVDAQRDMTWVVFDDPIPAGASHLGTGLGRDSSLAAADEQEGACLPVSVERSFAAIRAYYECLPKGETTFEYTIRFNQAGTFQLSPTRIEALYAPEMFGESPNQAVEVLP